ncbi:MAG: redoxin domain-containing protein, partial [Planctomycetes bacterium]|nr:redoxin domain-containing protein [Planctomycetota bacterium]
MHLKLVEYSGTLLAISVDSVAENKRVAMRNQLDFPILSDARRDVVWEYGLLHK